MRDIVPATTGHFRLRAYRHGLLVAQMDEPNIVVNGYKLVCSRLLGGDVTGRPVTQFGVGTSGAAPASGNTFLTDAVLKPIDGVSYPSTDSVEFAFSLAVIEAVGLEIQEFGLLSGDDTLFARKVRSAPLLKDDAMSIVGSWTIKF